MKKALTIIVLILFGISLNTYSGSISTIVEEDGIVLYIKNGCSLCMQAKALLDKRGLKYKMIPLDNDHAQVAKLVKETSKRMFPFIFINKQFIGGFAELEFLDDNGKLKNLVAIK